jgi:hypothetical protein
MATTLPFMLLTGSVHPPGGALVLTLVDSAKMQGLGWWYLICPGMLGLLVLLPMSALSNWVKVRSHSSFFAVSSAVGGIVSRHLTECWSATNGFYLTFSWGGEQKNYAFTWGPSGFKWLGKLA